MRFAVRIFGCRLNHAEAAAWIQRLSQAGWQFEADERAADLLIVHSCAVTAQAEKEALRLVRRLRRQTPALLLVLAGCAGETPAGIETGGSGGVIRIPAADKDRLAELLLERFAAPLEPRAGVVPFRTARALLKAQDGCSFFCAYCIVPHTRGAPRSKPFEQCLNEAKSFLAAGYEEIVVTGCNLACYADGGRRLPELIDALCRLPGKGRFRISSIEPGILDAALPGLFERWPERLCRFLHLPLQSGSDAVLPRMGRRYLAADLRRLLDRLPGNLALGCDLITGFPGETDADFEATFRLAEAYPFSNFHVFPYSPRPGTPAAAFPEQVDPALAKARAKRLIALAEKQRAAYVASLVGRPLSVLIEAEGETARGWCGEYVACEVPGEGAVRGKLFAFTPRAVVCGDRLI